MIKPDNADLPPTNKRVLEGLQKYFMENSDFKTVSRLLANMLIDFNRMMAVESLPQEEQVILLARCHANLYQLNKFIRNDFKGDGPFSPLDVAEI